MQEDLNQTDSSAPDGNFVYSIQELANMLEIMSKDERLADTKIIAEGGNNIFVEGEHDITKILYYLSFYVADILEG